LEQAVADGYTGVRAVVDCTALARTSGQRDRFAVLEYMLDRQRAASPISALCGYDAADLGAAGVAEIACLHPFIQAARSPFRLYADDGVSFALAGDLDLAGEGLFTTTLRRVLPMATESSLIIDGRRLEFIGHRALLALDRQAVANDRSVLLRNVAPVVARVAQLLPLRKLHVEPIAA
jgi:anti-anti-sigma regulatory factor